MILQPLLIAGLGSSPSAHHYSGNLFDFFYIRLLRCFTSPTSPLKKGLLTTQEEFPHSDIPASKAVCASAGLFAAYRVLRR